MWKQIVSRIKNKNKENFKPGLFGFGFVYFLIAVVVWLIEFLIVALLGQWVWNNVVVKLVGNLSQSDSVFDMVYLILWMRLAFFNCIDLARILSF